MPQLDAFGFVVDDMQRTLAFYRELGVPIPDDPTDGHVECTLPSGMRLMWDTADVITSFDTSWTRPVGSHRCALAFRCDSPGEVDTTYARVVARGFEGHLEPWDAFWGQRYASLRDPDGNAVDLYAPLDGAR